MYHFQCLEVEVVDDETGPVVVVDLVEGGLFLSHECIPVLSIEFFSTEITHGYQFTFYTITVRRHAVRRDSGGRGHVAVYYES